MKRRMILFVTLNAFLVGCRPTNDSVVDSRMRDEIADCVSDIVREPADGHYSQRIMTLVSELSAMSDKEALSSLVTDFASRLETVDFCVRDLGYVGYEEAVGRYNLCADGVSRLLREALGKDELWLAFFLKSKRKFKRFCFAVAADNALPGESKEDRRRRMSCAANLRVAYENEMMMWRCYMHSGGKAVLPSSLREAFVREARDLFETPNKHAAVQDEKDVGK